MVFTKYSALMTVYYKEEPEYLDASLRCLIQQSVQPSEIVVVCDGPLTDGLNAVLERYEESYSSVFRIVRLSENLGTGVATQTGIESCSFEYIMKLDSDDYCIPERAELQLIEFNNDDSLSVCGSYMGEFKETPDNIVQIRKVPLEQDEIMHFAKRRNPMNNITVMYRRSDVLLAGGYSDLRRCQDYELYARMLQRGFRMKNLPIVLSSARLNVEGLSRRTSMNSIRGFISVRWRLYENGFSSFCDFALSCGGQLLYSIMPVRIRDYAYRKLLRDESSEG